MVITKAFEIEQLNELKQRMLSVASVKIHAEIRKSARILAKGARTGSLFTNLPDEILIKIAGHTKKPGIYTQEEAEKIGAEHLSKQKHSCSD